MGDLVIRNLDDAVIAAYREAAARNRRTLEVELRERLKNFAPRTDSEITESRDRLARIRAMTPDVPQTPSEVLVREDRDGFRW
jgi:plasmid stability protein